MEVLSMLMVSIISVFIFTGWLLVIAIPILLIGGLLFSPIIILYFSTYQKKLYGPKILVVDDDFISITPLICALKKIKCQIKVVTGGSAAIEALSNESFEMVLLDYKMPYISGERVLKICERSLRVKNQIPVIFYTGCENILDQIAQLKYKNFRIVNVLEKKLKMTMLEERLSEILTQNQLKI